MGTAKVVGAVTLEGTRHALDRSRAQTAKPEIDASQAKLRVVDIFVKPETVVLTSVP